MDTSTHAYGLIELETSACVERGAGEIIVDFFDADRPAIDVNGKSYDATTVAELAARLSAHRRDTAEHAVVIPWRASAAGDRLVLTVRDDLTPVDGEALLGGREAALAVDRAREVVGSRYHSWPLADSIGDAARLTGDVAGAGGWDGPLVVAMPRTGSTLMGILFLFASDDSGRHRYRRYLHEPSAPVYWSGADVSSIARFLSPPLGPRDIVQESAYQFAHPRIAKWFLSRARRPVIFTIRHPQLSWPSRWRVMLDQLVAERPGNHAVPAARTALTRRDFSAMGDFLIRSVRPADNGFFSFVSLIQMCIDEGIEFAIVDNTRFRNDPERTMRGLCVRLGIEYDPAMVDWTTLEPVLDRVVMSDLALGDEYQWYYSRTLGSHRGILPETSELLDPEAFPGQLRGAGGPHLTIDEAVTWYRLLLARPEALA